MKFRDDEAARDAAVEMAVLWLICLGVAVWAAAGGAPS
jgi:hypothetical protein